MEAGHFKVSPIWCILIRAISASEERAMALDPVLLEILACPEDKADVKLTADEKGLKCVKCHRVYPIKDDIPVMLVEEATIDPSRAVKA